MHSSLGYYPSAPGLCLPSLAMTIKPWLMTPGTKCLGSKGLSKSWFKSWTLAIEK